MYPDLQRFLERDASTGFSVIGGAENANVEDATSIGPFSPLDWLSSSVFVVKFIVPFDGSTFGVSSSIEFVELTGDVGTVEFCDEAGSAICVTSFFSVDSVVGLEVGLLIGLIVKSA